MDIKVRLSRTWQQEQFQPITVDIELVQHDVTNFESAYEAAYGKVEKALIESEIRLRDMYDGKPAAENEENEEDWDKPIESNRKPKATPKRAPRRRKI